MVGRLYRTCLNLQNQCRHTYAVHAPPFLGCNPPCRADRGNQQHHRQRKLQRGSTSVKSLS